VQAALSKVQVLGIDAGGTMTDTFFVRDDGRFVVGKAQSNPDDESLAIYNSSEDALAHWQRNVDGVYPELVTCVYSGTAMINRVLQRKGLDVGLLCNKGFEHVHGMGRAVQSYLGYALEERIHLNAHRYDDPLVPLHRIRGVTERTDVQGQVVIPIREAEVREAVRQLVEAGAKAIVICLLQSHKNGASERQARDIAKAELSKLGHDLPVFGYVEGAFTGARKGGMSGKIEAAHGGTLFLDEIGELPLDMQPLLLRVLEQGEVWRLGENTPRRVDFRLVAATHRDLRQEVAAGRFRMDLYYRIAVARLQIPALRARGHDVRLLAQHYLAHFRRQAGQPVESLSDAVAACLCAYDWPGNVRELRNVMEAAVLISEGAPLDVSMLPPELQQAVPPAAAPPDALTASPVRLYQAQAVFIRQAIAAANGNLTRAARQLGIAKSTLYAKIRAYGLNGG